MNRIAQRFAELKRAGRPGLVTFITAGDPDRETSQRLLNDLPASGADFIELGMPFSDPMADGPVIQEASQRALKAGATVERTLSMAASFRVNDTKTPLILMGYFNPIYAYGTERFAVKARESGVDGLIVVDLPPEEGEELDAPVRNAGIDMIRLVAPTTDNTRLPVILKNAGGFIYYVSVTGIMQRQHYLAAALAFDRELLAKLDEESHRQSALQEELSQKREELAEQKQSLRNAHESIRQEARKKQLLLTSLRREKDTRLRALKEMEAAARRLEKMMEEISRRALVKPRELPGGPSPGKGLEALRGRLEWPVRGQVTAPFGKFKHPEFEGEILRKGIDIEVQVGEEVKAVQKGRVVYADRFSGYGKIVIVDHGKRYYTIYGHLSDISKKTGEAVNPGDTLGLAGDSDSLAGSKLYFEIRKDGHSLDPLSWLRKH